jgi:hypothetical protein
MIYLCKYKSCTHKIEKKKKKKKKRLVMSLKKCKRLLSLLVSYAYSKLPYVNVRINICLFN